MSGRPMMSRAAELHSLINKKCDRRESSADLRRIGELVVDLDTLSRIREAAEPVRGWLQQFPVAFYPDLRALLRAIDGEKT